MRAFTRPLVLGSLALAALAGTAPASATTRCAGEQTVFAVCVTTPSLFTGSTTYCIYTGGTSCTPVTVPGPDFDENIKVTCQGSVGSMVC